MPYSNRSNSNPSSPNPSQGKGFTLSFTPAKPETQTVNGEYSVSRGVCSHDGGKHLSVGINPLGGNGNKKDIGATPQPLTPHWNPGGDWARCEKEWRASGIDPLFFGVALDVWDGDGAREVVLGHRLDGMKLNGFGHTSAPAARLLAHFPHLEHGGWYARSIDPLTGRDTGWGVFKPRVPRVDPKRKRVIKYESPLGVPKEVYFAPVPWGIGHRIACEHGLGDKYLSRMPEDAGKDDEDKGVWDWACLMGLPVYVVEGVKKALSLLSIGLLAVGVNGCPWGSRNRGTQDKPDWVLSHGLQALVDMGFHGFILIPDQDEKEETRRNVRRGFTRTGDCLKTQGASVSVADWPSNLGKGIDDVVAQWGPDVAKKILSQAVPLTIYKSGLTIPPDQTVSQRYLDVSLPERGLVAIRSPKGSGKTELIGRNIPQWKIDSNILCLTHRRSLSRDQATRFQVGYNAETNGGMALCLDSLRSGSQIGLKIEDWEGATVIIDEAKQVADHLVRGGTEIRKNRIEIINNLKTILRTAKRAIILDADLTDDVIRFFEELIFGVNPTGKAHLILNTSRPTFSAELYSYEHAPELVERLIEAINRGERALVFTTSQKESGSYAAQNLKVLIEKECPGKSVLVLDSETTKDPQNPAQLAATAPQLLMSAYDVTIATPVIETGVSLDQDGLFDSVWAIANGLTSVSNLHQSLARYRSPAPRHVFVPSYAKLGMVDGKHTTPEGIRKYLNEKRVLALVHAGIDGDLRYCDDAPLRYYCQRGATVNLENIKYRENFLRVAAEIEGYTIVPVNFGYLRETEDLIKDIKEDAKDRHCEGILSAMDIDDITAERWDHEDKKTREQVLALTKWSIRKYYGIVLTKGLVYADQYLNSRTKLKRLYDLTRGYRFLQGKDSKLIEVLMCEGEGWAPDLASKPKKAGIDTLKFIGLESLLYIPLDRILTGDDADIQKLFKNATDCKDRIKLLFGITVASNPIGALNQLRGLVGLPPVKKKNKSKNCKKYIPPSESEQDDPGRISPEQIEAIFDGWESRDTAKLEPAQTEQVSIPEPQERGPIPFVQGVLNWMGAAVRWKDSLSPEVPQDARATVLRDGGHEKSQLKGRIPPE